jgi:hypothetical protein
MVVVGYNDTFEEIKFRAFLAVTQLEVLQERSRAFQRVVREARDHLARVNEARVKMSQSIGVDASSS